MQIDILGEYGYDHALLGMSLSYYDHKEPISTWWNEEKKQKADKRAKLLAGKDGGHNKFLEHITVYLYIQAARSFWSEFDTYRVGMSKQSSSTMHTLDKRETEHFDYERGTSIHSRNAFNSCLLDYRDPNSLHYKDVTRLKDNLPEGWLQEREIVTNYKTIRNIYKQRLGHRLKYWKPFCDMIGNLEHSELILNNKN
jgi:thymidylate synthase ThyX